MKNRKLISMSGNRKRNIEEINTDSSQNTGMGRQTFMNSQDKKQAFISEYLQNRYNVSAACRSIGIRRPLVYEWIDTDPAFAQRYDEAKEERNDWLEQKLFDLVEKGNVAAAIFCSKCQLGKRGYKPDIHLNVGKGIKEHVVISKEHLDSIVRSGESRLDFDKMNLPSEHKELLMKAQGTKH
jgi:hypothetical protein